MALNAANLIRLVPGYNSIYIYDAGADAIATVKASGYFNGVTAQLRQKDIILVVSSSITVLTPIVVTSTTGNATVTTA